MVRVEKINHEQGWHKLFYVIENKKTENLSIYCYAPQGNKVPCKVKQLEDGLYVFNFYFKHFGKYVFVCFEDGKKMLIIIATIKR